MPTEHLICALATPLRADLTVDHALLLAHGRALLGRGCDGLAVFGTSGEGPCLPVATRRAALEFLLESGIAPDRLIVGAASASLADAIELTRHARACGIERVLLMPPFFLRAAASEAGLFRFYAAVIEAADPGLRLLLYHFPAISGAPLPLGLIARLRETFGEVIFGIKDSGGDWPQTAAYLEAFPALVVYTGTEVHARRALSGGGAGTICGLANILPQAMRRFLDAPDAAAAEPWLALIGDVDDALCVGPFLPACKAAIALATGADAWRRVLPPLASLDEEELDRLRTALAAIAERHGLPVG